MKFDPAGWLTTAHHKISRNFNQRPPNSVIDLLVIHCISLPEGEFGTGYPEDLFLNRLDISAHPDFDSLCRMRVSAHFLIDRLGNLSQFVSVYDRAWHAGESCFQGRVGCNDFSLGIELEGDVHSRFEHIQYEVLSQLTRVIMQSFPEISAEHIVGHSDIAQNRKQDPGPYFDWIYYRNLILSAV